MLRRSIWIVIVALSAVSCVAEDRPEPQPPESRDEDADAAAELPTSDQDAIRDVLGRPDDRATGKTEIDYLPKAGGLPEGVSPKWKPYFDALPFVMGAEEGLKVAKALNRPALLFYAATW